MDNRELANRLADLHDLMMLVSAQKRALLAAGCNPFLIELAEMEPITA